MGWLGRALGSFGSDIGEARDINQRWQDQLLQIAQRKAQMAQQQMMFPLQMQHLQGEINQMGHPTPQGVRDTPGGGMAGFTYDQNTGKFGSQDLVPSQRPQTVAQAKQIIQQMAANAETTLGAQHKGRFDPYLAELDLPDSKPEEILGRAIAENNQLDRTAPRASGWSVYKSGPGGEPTEVINYDTNQRYVADDPKLPPEGQAAVKRATKVAQDQRDYMMHRTQVQADIASKRMIAANNFALQRQFAGEAKVLQDRYIKGRASLSAVPQLQPGQEPTPDQSQALADALDRITGGTLYKADLQAQGRKQVTPIIGGLLRQSPYTPAAYSAAEFADKYQTAQMQLQQLQEDATSYTSAFAPNQGMPVKPQAPDPSKDPAIHAR